MVTWIDVKSQSIILNDDDGNDYDDESVLPIARFLLLPLSLL